MVQVTLTGGAEHPAKIVGFDEDRDVAVLQLVTTEGEPVSALPLLHWVVIHCHKRKFKKLLHLPPGSLTSTRLCMQGGSYEQSLKLKLSSVPES